MGGVVGVGVGFDGMVRGWLFVSLHVASWMGCEKGVGIVVVRFEENGTEAMDRRKSGLETRRQSTENKASR